jgi:Xaa-Pro dipeptidase
MTDLFIPADEFVDRQNRACSLAAERGFDALVVWSRGGATGDFYGDVFYLANHVTPFPTQPDNLPTWAGRGHSVLILPVGGEPVLIVDSHDYRADLAAVKDVRIELNVPATVASVLTELELAGANLGLVGRDSVLLAHYQMICAALGATPRLTPCDDILETLRLFKSDAELQLLRSAAGIGVEAMTTMIDAVAAGCTEADVAGEGWRAAARRGGLPYDTAIASGPHSEHFQWARLPSWDHVRPLQRGELIHIDLYGPMQSGYWVDMARTTVVGGSPSAAQEAVLEGAIDLVETVISAVRPGVRFGELWQVGDDWRNSHGFPVLPEDGSGCLVGLDADFPAFGHTVGLGLESALIRQGSPLVVAPNMVLSVETLLSRAGVGGANFEENLIVTADGCERLTDTMAARCW